MSCKFITHSCNNSDNFGGKAGLQVIVEPHALVIIITLKPSLREQRLCCVAEVVNLALSARRDAGVSSDHRGYGQHAFLRIFSCGLRLNHEATKAVVLVGLRLRVNQHVHAPQ